MYTHIVALLEAIREREVTLGLSSVGALQSLVRFFCEWVCTASLGANLPPSLTITVPSVISTARVGEVWERRETSCLDPLSEEDEEDAHSVPGSLPNLIDSAGEEERPSLIGLATERDSAPGDTPIPG